MKNDSGFSCRCNLLWKLSFLGVFACLLIAPEKSLGQNISNIPLPEPTLNNPLLTSTMQPGTAFLFDLERKFAVAVAQGGGAAFASFFDEDGITIQNRQAPLIGQVAIAAHTTWSPKTYQLTWKPEGGELSPADDMGYTWGHYEGRSIGATGVVEHGRYQTVWKKEPDGSWKVLMDSSNEDPPEPECKCSTHPTE